MTLEYDAGAPPLATALRISNTIIPEVVSATEFWFLLLLNCCVRTLRYFHLFEPELYGLDLPFRLTAVTGSLMTFFVCFYNGHVFHRYNTLYEITQAMSEHVVQLASALRLQIEDVRVQRKVVKLVLASCYTFFFERTSGVSKREWYQLWRLGLVSELEVRSLMRHSRHIGEHALPSFMLLQWAAEFIFTNTNNLEDREDMLSQFTSLIYHVRKCQAQVVQTMELPMPFQYFHIMNLMLMINLVLWAYALGCQDSYFAPLIYMFVQMMFQGIRELSTALSDPFGDDDVDFPVNDWMKLLYSRIFGIVEDDFSMDELQGGLTRLQHPNQVMAKLNLHTDLRAS